MSFCGGSGLFTEFLREGGTRTLMSVRTWHADIISWLLVSGTHLFDVVLEYRIMDFSGRRLPGMFPYSALVGSTVDTSLRQSTVLSAMLGSTVDTYCRARRRFRSGMAVAGMLVTMLSRCVHFVVGRPVESPQEQSQRQVPAASFASCVALCIGTRPGGHVHRDMTP